MKVISILLQVCVLKGFGPRNHHCAAMSRDSQAGVWAYAMHQAVMAPPLWKRLTTNSSVPSVLAEQCAPREALLQPAPFQISSPSQDETNGPVGASKLDSNEVERRRRLSQEGGWDEMANGERQVPAAYPGCLVSSMELHCPHNPGSSEATLVPLLPHIGVFLHHLGTLP